MVLALVLTAVVIAALAAGMPGAALAVEEDGSAGSAPPDGFADGYWLLFLTPRLHVEGDFGGGGHLTNDIVMGGSGSFRVRGGEVVEGTHASSGQGRASMVGPDASGTFEPVMGMEGGVEGDAGDLRLVGTGSISGTATITVAGITRSQPIDLTSPIDPPARLVPFSVTCDMVTGDFTLDYRAVLEGYGLRTTGDGAFLATRVLEPNADDDAATPLADDVNALFMDVLAETARVEGGSLDAGRVLELLGRGERLLPRLHEASECRAEGPWFAHLLGPMMHDLLRAVADRAGDVDTILLGRMVSAGYRTGAIGGTDPAGDAVELEADLQAIFADRLAAALAAGDDVELATIGVAAAEFGWAELADEAFGELRGEASS